MKKACLSLVTLLLGLMLQAQEPVLFKATTPAPRPEGRLTVSNFAPNTRAFLREWEQYQNELQAAQTTKSEVQEQAARTRLSKIADAYGLRTVKTAKGAVGYTLPVFVRFESEAALQAAIEKGLTVNTKLKTICTGTIAPEDLPALNGLNDIRVETSTKVTPSLDSTRFFSQVNAAHQGGTPYGTGEDEILSAYRGEGVVVGIVDGGFDYTHPTFYDPFDQSVYRVKRVWDQQATSGSAPKGYDYGVEYTTTADILAAQHDHWENGSHGTHVAGIAGGSGAGTRYGGMAPKSDLVFVPRSTRNTSVFDGIKYIMDYAISQHKPCVVNLSLGSHIGPHDGTSSFDQACDQIKSNGFILVGAAGNEGSDPLYIQHRFTALTQDTLMFSCIEFQNTNDKTTLLDIWSDNDEDLYIFLGLVNSSGKFISVTQPFISYMTDTIQHLMDGDDIAVTIKFYSEHNPDNSKARIYADIDASPFNGMTDFNGYSFVMQLGSIRSNRTMSAQMWLNSAIFTNTGFKNNPLVKAGSVSHTVDEVGGTGNSIISVGAYMSRVQWTDLNGKKHQYYNAQSQHIAPFSSLGPTADGRMKPDITAPGCHIISAYNSFDQSDNTIQFVESVKRNNRTYCFGNMQGTSMAAPAAAGIIALWLQADPTLNVDKVKTVLKETALNYPGIGTPGAEYTWGYGKIDALAGLQYIEQHKLKVETQDATDITYASALLHFSVTNGEGMSGGLYYHTTPSVKEGKSVPTDANPYPSTLWTITLNNLKSETTYYYQAYALQDGDTVWGNVMQFQTDVNPLTVTTESPENVTANAATLYLSAENATDARLGFYYHSTSDVQEGQYIAAAHDKGSVYKANIRNLKPDSYYFYQAVGFSGGDTVTGQTLSFRTLQNTANEALVSAEPLTVYPNPVAEAGELTVELPFDPTTEVWLNLMDISGKTLKLIPVTTRQFTLTDLKAGFYILQIDRPTANGNVRYQAKVIVQ